MSTVQTENIAAVLPDRKARLVIQTRPIPKPGPDELIIRNHAIAANPVDWKIQDYELFLKKYPNVVGSDVCGQVVDVGSNVKLFKKGDRVTGFSAVIYNSNIDHGAWQTYTILRELATTKIPDSMSYEEGSVFPMAFATAAIALFVILGIPRIPAPGSKDVTNHVLLVWGAGSSVGSAAVQIAKLWGYTVYGTASRSNHHWIKNLGAAKVFDYHDVDVVDQIVSAAKAEGKTVKIAFDPISEGVTFDQVPAVVTKSAGGGKVAIVLYWPEGKKYPANVDVSLTVAMRHGTDQSDLGAWLFNVWLQKALQDGSVTPAPPIQIVEGGLETTQKVFDDLKAGVSGKKLVMKIK